MQANLGDARVNGCPANNLITRIYTSPAAPANPMRFLTLTAIEGSCGSTSAFDYRRCPNPWPDGTILSAVPLPRPRVISSGQVGNQILVHWQFDPTAAGNPNGDPAGAVTGYELVKANGSDPGRDPAGWTSVASVTSDGSSPVTLDAPVDCTASPNQYFATRLLFRDGEKSLVVSHPLWANCNPSLAEPHFNLVPKRPTGPAKKPATP
jgi:hypothetical protein